LKYSKGASTLNDFAFYRYYITLLYICIFYNSLFGSLEQKSPARYAGLKHQTTKMIGNVDTFRSLLTKPLLFS